MHINKSKEILTITASILYRLLILILGIYIFSFHSGCYSIVFYSITSIVYLLLLLFVVYSHLKKFPLIRTIIDISFITIILFNKELNGSYSLIYTLYLLLPYINSRNHSEKKRNPFLVGMLIIVALFILHIKVKLIIFCFLLISVVSFIDFLSNTGKILNAELDKVIIEGFSSSSKFSLHNILEKLIEIVNRSRLTNLFLNVKTISILKNSQGTCQ